MSSSSQEPRASEKLAAMFSLGSEETGNQCKSSVFKHADPSNLVRSLLQGNIDHLLSQARSEIFKQLTMASVSFSSKLMLKDWNYRTLNTMQAYETKTNVLILGNVHVFVDESRIHLGPKYYAILEIHKNTKFEKIESLFNVTQKVGKGTF